MGVWAALIYEVFQQFSGWFAHNFGLFRQDEFPKLVSQHSTHLKSEKNSLHLPSPINNNNLQHIVETHTCEITQGLTLSWCSADVLNVQHSSLKGDTCTTGICCYSLGKALTFFMVITPGGSLTPKKKKTPPQSTGIINCICTSGSFSWKAFKHPLLFSMTLCRGVHGNL